MKYVNVKLSLVLFITFFCTKLFAQDFSATLVRNQAENVALKKALERLGKDVDPDFGQAIKVNTNKGSFFIVPMLSASPKQEGCYVQLVNSEFNLGNRYLVEKSEEAQSCDIIQAIYTCKLPNENGVGVISGIRLVADHYYSSNTFFDLNDSSELIENNKLTKLINSVKTASKARKKLGCAK